MTSNENKMSDGGRGRASLGVEVWKPSQKWSVQRSAVRSIAWLGLLRGESLDMTCSPVHRISRVFGRCAVAADRRRSEERSIRYPAKQRDEQDDAPDELRHK